MPLSCLIQLFGIFYYKIFVSQTNKIMKQVNLTSEQAKGLYNLNPELRNSVLSEFTNEELGITEILEGYFVDKYLHLIPIGSTIKDPSYKNVFAKKVHALSAGAMAKLSQLMKSLGDECNVNWEDDSEKYIIDTCGKSVFHALTVNKKAFLAFKSEDACLDFLNNHHRLIEKYFMI